MTETTPDELTAKEYEQVNNLPPCPWCKKPPQILNIAPMEVCCVTEGCPPHLNAVTPEVWANLGSHEKEVALIPPEEPIFIMRGQDQLALVPIYQWIDLAEKKHVPEEKLETAMARANEMNTYQRAVKSKLPD